MTSIIDKKLDVVFDKYQDHFSVLQATHEVEDIRTRATYTGAVISTSAFVLNEFIRMTTRSPVFKLRIQNVAFWAVAPTLLARYYGAQQVEDLIAPIWRVHKNRVDQGKGSTYDSSGYHESHENYKDVPAQVYNWVLSFSQIFNGTQTGLSIDNPFLRHHKSFEEYPSHLYDQDDHAFTITDQFERLKVQQPLEKNVVGGTDLIPPKDNDEEFVWSDIQGENLFTNPPSPCKPLVDSGMDEENIWAFPLSNYNQEMVINKWYGSGSRAHIYSYAPFWGHKLAMPHFYKPEKMEKFFRHWNHRKGLETLKQKQVLKYGQMPSEAAKVQMNNEIGAYIESCYDYEEKEKLSDVYVTDHSEPEKKYLTHSSTDDKSLYDYHKAMEEYNASNAAVQKTAKKVEQTQEEEIIAELVSGNTPFSVEHFDAVINAELKGVFSEGEKYSFTKDLATAYKKSLSQSLEDQMLASIPDHHFWDIKKPQSKEQYMPKNRYNPFRGREFGNYFEIVDFEEYMAGQTDHNNRNIACSYYRRY